MLYDAIIVGGSFAGLTAALQLARARKHVLVIDAGLPRNRFASHSHGVFAQDGKSGSEMLATAAAQLLAYPTAEIFKCTATAAQPHDGGFVVEVDGGTRWFSARRLLLATGVKDVLPDVPGLAERWGSTVLHCPYCHGYEIGGAPIGVLAAGPMSAHQAAMVADWGEVTLFLNQTITLDDSAKTLLAARRVNIESTPVAALEGTAPGISVRLQDGRRFELGAVFTGAGVRPASPLAEQLGCQIDEGPMGPIVYTDAMKQTSVKGVYAAGDMAKMPHSISLACADGMMAGVCLHQSLMGLH